MIGISGNNFPVKILSLNVSESHGTWWNTHDVGLMFISIICSQYTGEFTIRMDDIYINEFICSKVKMYQVETSVASSGKSIDIDIYFGNDTLPETNGSPLKNRPQAPKQNHQVSLQIPTFQLTTWGLRFPQMLQHTCIRLCSFFSWASCSCGTRNNYLNLLKLWEISISSNPY